MLVHLRVSIHPERCSANKRTWPLYLAHTSRRSKSWSRTRWIENYTENKPHRCSEHQSIVEQPNDVYL